MTAEPLRTRDLRVDRIRTVLREAGPADAPEAVSPPA
jgi:hypothetical protein